MEYPEETDDRLPMVEALLFASEKPVSASRLVGFLGKSSARKIPELIEKLNDSYSVSGRVFRVREVAGGYQMYLMPTYTRAVENYLGSHRERRLSQAALETLAVVAYKQPVSRADIEHVRGVNSGGVLASLLERKLTAIVGRSDKVGRPLLYGTTDRFLEYFGLRSLNDLPSLEELVLPDENDEDGQVELRLHDDSQLSAEDDVDSPANIAEHAPHSDNESCS
jgi:segregation and condensation protein B